MDNFACHAVNVPATVSSVSPRVVGLVMMMNDRLL